MSDTFIGDSAGPINDLQQNLTEFGFTKLYGIAGDDLLGTGIVGTAYLDGGQGDDFLQTAWAGGQTIGEFYGGSGNDRIQGGSSSAGDSIYAGSGDDFVEQNPGGSGPDYVEGGQGRDALRGQAGNDAIFGGDGNDSGSPITAGGANGAVTVAPGLFGGAGSDFLVGGRGNDSLVGGTGKDTLIGGAGNDRFKFNAVNHSPSGTQRDTILGFDKADHLDLSGIDAKAGSGNDDFDYVGSKAFSGKSGELRFDNGKLQGDINGDRAADFEVRIDGTLKASQIDL